MRVHRESELQQVVCPQRRHFLEATQLRARDVPLYSLPMGSPAQISGVSAASRTEKAQMYLGWAPLTPAQIEEISPAAPFAMEYSSGLLKGARLRCDVIHGQLANLFRSEFLFALDTYAAVVCNPKARTAGCPCCSPWIGLSPFVLVDPLLILHFLWRICYSGPLIPKVEVENRLPPIARLGGLVQVIAIFGR